MDFKQFLKKAKLSGYATRGEGREIKLKGTQVYKLIYHGGAIAKLNAI